MKKANEESRRIKKLVDEIERDFERRRSERKALESAWLLALHFVAGNQYTDVNLAGEVEEECGGFCWQGRRVFNCIAPTLETRQAKLKRMRKKLKIYPFSDEESDRKVAKLASDILKNVSERIRLEEIVERGVNWSETCGTAFYFVSWNDEGGRQLARSDEGGVYEGEVEVEVVSPFEIYPDSLGIEGLDEQRSIIRARAVLVKDIEAAYGVKLAGRDSDEFGILPAVMPSRDGRGGGAVLHDAELLIERYTLPDLEHVEGKLEIVAGGKLLYEGRLPFANREHGKRGYPFVKQVCLRQAGAFFGSSVVDRLIPLQRSYNAVRNRKQECLNRLSMGVIAVEDGSVDAEELVSDGLRPGKVLVYRQGSEPPKMLDPGSVPSEYEKEEERLLEEFVLVSGTGEALNQRTYSSGITSATGLQLLIDQEAARLAVVAGNIGESMREIARHILRLYREFAGEKRLLRVTGEGKKVKISYFCASDVSADDILFEEGEETNSLTRRSLVFELLEKGLLSDDEGKVPIYVKNEILDEIGYGALERVEDLTSLHRHRAQEENLSKGKLVVKEYDDDDVHILEHTRYLLSEEAKNEGVILSHIGEHRKKKEERNGTRG